MKKGLFAPSLPAFLAAVFLAYSCSLGRWESSELSGARIVEEDIVVGAGQTLTIPAGSSLRFGTNAGILVLDGGALVVQGTAEAPVTLSPASSSWLGMRAAGPGSSLSIEHAVIIGSSTQAFDGASLVIINSELHSYFTAVPAIVDTTNAASAVVRGCYVHDYYEMHFFSTPATVRDCLLERMTGDGIDFDNSPPETAVIGCTIRSSTVRNVDAIDFGIIPYMDRPASSGTVRDCLIHDITDKGVSAGEGCLSVTVSNTLIYNVGIGVSSKDGSNVLIDGLTIAECNYGLNCYEERAGMGGGRLAISNSLLWKNLVPARSFDGSALSFDRVASDASVPGHPELLPVLDSDIVDDSYAITPSSSLMTAAADGGAIGVRGAQGTLLYAAVPAMTTPVFFSVMGESGGVGEPCAAIINEFLEDVPDIALHTGDIVADGSSAEQWDAFDSAIVPLAKVSAFFPCPSDSDLLDAGFLARFGLGSSYYAIRKKNAVILMLDSSLPIGSGSPQYGWLQSELSSAASDDDVAFRFVVVHLPVVTAGTAAHPDPALDFASVSGQVGNPIADLQGLFELYGVDVVFQTI